MPGVGVRTAARLLTEVAHKAFASAAHLAAYAGLAPVTRRSGSSIRGEHPSRRGNKVLKRALFLSAFAALRDPISRDYYARKVQQGKRHNQALIALARRRCDVLFAMLRDGTLYGSVAVRHCGRIRPPLQLHEDRNVEVEDVVAARNRQGTQAPSLSA
jgi:hypothetical protein